MNWKCLLLGCTWNQGYIWHSLGEPLKTCACVRCGAQKTESAA